MQLRSPLFELAATRSCVPRDMASVRKMDVNPAWVRSISHVQYVHRSGFVVLKILAHSFAQPSRRVISNMEVSIYDLFGDATQLK